MQISTQIKLFGLHNQQLMVLTGNTSGIVALHNLSLGTETVGSFVST